MDFTADTPRVERTIAGRRVSVIQPFAEGQPLTAATAAMLNQTLAENFSNNTRSAIEAGVLTADGKPCPRRSVTVDGKTREVPANPLSDEAVQALLDAYMAEYIPGVRSGGGGTPRVTDPIEREARKLARAKADEHVRAKGGKPKDYDMAQITEAIFAKYQDKFMAGGKKIVAQLEAAKNAATEFDLGDVELSAKPAEATPAETTPAPAEG